MCVCGRGEGVVNTSFNYKKSNGHLNVNHSNFVNKIIRAIMIIKNNANASWLFNSYTDYKKIVV